MTYARIPSLDGIRTVSISFVVLAHFIKAGWGDPLDLGQLGVRIFYVISGYLITDLLLKELEKHGRINLLRFYFRRTLRLFPAFYFYMGCMLVVAAFGGVTLSWQDAIPAITYTSNYFIPVLQPVVQHTWSLATEEQFYLIWPAALMLAGRRHAISALLTLLILAGVSAHFEALALGHKVPTFFNGPIGIGCLFALIQESVHKNDFYKRWIGSHFGVFLPLLILVCNFPAFHTGGVKDQAVGLMQNVVIAISLDWAIVNNKRFECRWLNSGPMVYIGILSYSLYLWQQPFTQPFLTYSDTITTPVIWNALTNPAIQLSGMAACTLISYYAIERPMLRWRAKVEPKLFQKPNLGTVPTMS